MTLIRSSMMALAFASVVGVASRGASAQSEQSQSERLQPAEVKQMLSSRPYRFVGGETQRQAVHDAIERAVAPMNFIERPIARGRLRDRNRVEDSLAFRFQPGTVSVVLGGHELQSPDNFAPAPGRAITGEAMQVRQRLVGDRVVQSLRTGEGERRDEFAVSPDGRRVTMRVTVHSPKLRAPMQYSLDYAR